MELAVGVDVSPLVDEDLLEVSLQEVQVPHFMVGDHQKPLRVRVVSGSPKGEVSEELRESDLFKEKTRRSQGDHLRRRLQRKQKVDCTFENENLTTFECVDVPNYCLVGLVVRNHLFEANRVGDVHDLRVVQTDLVHSRVLEEDPEPVDLARQTPNQHEGLLMTPTEGMYRKSLMLSFRRGRSLFVCSIFFSLKSIS